MKDNRCFLGIDPGTRRVGFGVVSGTGSEVGLVDAGLLHIPATDHQQALLQIRNGLVSLITKFRPRAMAVEKLYFAKNQTTALQVAEARGVIMLTALENNLPILEYNPNEIKLNIAGYGAADKKAVQKMVRLILHTPELKVIDDTSDALALAILAAGARLDG